MALSTQIRSYRAFTVFEEKLHFNKGKLSSIISDIYH